MIHAAFIKNVNKTPCKWWPKVEGLKRRKTLRFKAGLNILWGRNGTGKSTLLTALARYFHCEQGGHSVVTGNSVRAMSLDLFRDDLCTGMKVEHDGQPVFYVNPSQAIGLIGGGAGFDDDFFMEGVMNTTAHISAGQTTLMRTNMVMKKLKEGVKEIEFKQKPPEGIEKMLKPTSDEKGPVTILLDEPDRSMDIDFARQLWDLLPLLARERQIIVATHHPFALGCDNEVYQANFIDLGDKEYRGTCTELVRGLGELTKLP